VCSSDLGHLAGDGCLRQVASALNEVVNRPADLVARYGGEEFVVVLPHTDIDGAVKLAKILCEIKANTQFVINRVSRRKADVKTKPHKNKSVQVTVSIGIADSKSKKTSLKLSAWDVLKLSDKALYRAKGKGRNCVCN